MDWFIKQSDQTIINELRCKAAAIDGYPDRDIREALARILERITKEKSQ